VDLVRSIVADWERGDYGSAEWADPDIELVAVGGPEPGAWTGVAAMGRAWRDFLSAWEEYRLEADEYRELDERVLMLYRVRARGKTSGFEVGQTETSSASIFHVRNGKVIRLGLYWQRDRALADLGLEA
jgi:ketosteroid isomerase-like protein